MQKVIIAIVAAFVAGAALVYWRFPEPSPSFPAEIKTEVVTKTVTDEGADYPTRRHHYRAGSEERGRQQQHRQQGN